MFVAVGAEATGRVSLDQTSRGVETVLYLLGDTPGGGVRHVKETLVGEKTRI